jgi:hypothetical protein
MVELIAFPQQHGVQTRSAKLAPLFRQLSQTGSDFFIVLGFRLIPATAPAQPDNIAGPSFA